MWDDPSMLSARTALSRDGVEIAVETLFDPTVAYCMNPGEEQRYDHPHAHDDDCTSLSLGDELLASLWGGEPTLPSGPLFVSPQLDLEHRLLAAAHRGEDPHEVIERTIALTARALERADPRRVATGQPATVKARRALADEAREALGADPDRSLPDLARALAVSPHHLSRVFRSATGQTISRHRMRLRVRGALERLAGGSATWRGWPPTSASPIRAIFVASCAARRGRLRPCCVRPSPSGHAFSGAVFGRSGDSAMGGAAGAAPPMIYSKR